MKYITDDGTEFDNLAEAQAYEKKTQKIINQVKGLMILPRMLPNFPEFEENTSLEDTGACYFVGTESDRKAILSFIPAYSPELSEIVESMPLPNFILTDSDPIVDPEDEINDILGVGTNIITTLREKWNVYSKLLEKARG